MNTISFKIAILATFILSCDQTPRSRDKMSVLPDPEHTKPAPMCDAIWDVRFSPNGGATATLVDTLRYAKQSIYVQAYSFTSVPIAEALIAAHRRGIHVEVILDKSDKTGKGSVLPMLVNSGITVFIDNMHAIAHNKIMILDKATVFTGSFNFTNAAEHNNAENSISLRDEKLAAIYMENWNLHRQHALIQNP